MPLWTPPTIGLFQRGTSGAPSLAFVRQVAGITSYEHSITNQGGFESMTVSLTTTPADAWWWTAQLMSSCIVTGPDAVTCWEGYLTGVEATIEGQQVNVNLDGMANRVRCRYTTAVGVAGVTATTSDTASIALYGTKDYVESVGTVSATTAAALAAARLRQKKNPNARRTTPVGSGAADQSSDGSVTLSFAGWYTTLDWVLTSRADTSTEATTTQVTDLLAASGVGVGVTNPYLASVSIGTASGINDTRQIDPDTTYRSKIETLLAQGLSTGERYAWGVFDGRAFTVKQWAGATPSLATYYTSARTRTVYDAALGTAEPWNLRPDAMVAALDVHDPAPVGTAQDASGRFYCGRVSARWSAEGWSADLEPDDVLAVDALLARLH